MIARGWGFLEKVRSEEHTSELQSHVNLVCRLLLEKKKKRNLEMAACRKGLVDARECSTLADSTEATPSSLRVSRRWRRHQMIPILEIAVFAVFAAAPFIAADYLTVFVTRVLILALLALSFDLVWGYSGIMSFGQALFFGTAGYGVALLARDLEITSIFIVLPAALVIGLCLSLVVGGFLLLGRQSPTRIFVALGTLTGSYLADRL